MGAYLYKIGSILHRKQPEFLSENPKSLKREEVLFNQFINLLTEHHRKERRVDFYAEQLFLSPKHFSTVVKKVSGKTAGEWIDEYVILEAKALLKYSVMSIQEVAYFMNFPNLPFWQILQAPYWVISQRIQDAIMKTEDKKIVIQRGLSEKKRTAPESKLYKCDYTTSHLKIILQDIHRHPPMPVSCQPHSDGLQDKLLQTICW